MNQTDKKGHWENIYQTKEFHEVGWFQSRPDVSLEFIDILSVPKNAKIIDVGAGESYLVDHLLDRGFGNIYVLDISSSAIEKAKYRLGENAKKINWIVSDILEFKINIGFKLWHDRAAFHFLLKKEEIEKYVENAVKGIIPGGYLIIGTFSEKGPDKCSGLPVRRYSINELESTFLPYFKKIKALNIDHITPGGQVQNYSFCCFKRL
ncbi:class I SAM-dependent methyltransferase [Shivajiella indica]|uniref:Class I SAM-dependent methyltransferase n=1 Tax=Shivajiella indica TaxID=872115 RepID=A0ABW5B4P1_9BACT